MNKQKIINIIFIITIISLLAMYLDQNRKLNKYIISEANDSSSDSAIGGSEVAIMLETAQSSGTYAESSLTTWPTVSDGYYFNPQKSSCENGSILSYNYGNNHLSIATNKTDKCYVYFDIITFYSKILTDNGGVYVIIAKRTPSFSSATTTNLGMYAASDDY